MKDVGRIQVNRKMSAKVYMTHQRSTFVCPQCSRKTPVDLSETDLSKTNGIALKCACGYAWTSSMERRRHYRKPVKFKGRYHYSNKVELEQGVVAGKFIGKGRMDVVDVSARGLKIKIRKKEEFKLNDQLFVEFHLDDEQKTLIREKALVKKWRYWPMWCFGSIYMKAIIYYRCTLKISRGH